MDIQEALSELSRFFDMIYIMGILTEEEELISKVEETINNYVNKRN